MISKSLFISKSCEFTHAHMWPHMRPPCPHVSQGRTESDFTAMLSACYDLLFTCVNLDGFLTPSHTKITIFCPDMNPKFTEHAADFDTIDRDSKGHLKYILYSCIRVLCKFGLKLTSTWLLPLI